METRDPNALPAEGRRDLFFLVALAALLAVLYLPQFFSGRTTLDDPGMMDVTSQFYPTHVFGRECYVEGVFPLWNPRRYSGMPWLGYSHTGALYPVNISLYYLFDFLTAAPFLHFFHGLVSAVGVYLFLKWLGGSRFASFLCGIVFSCSGFFFYLQNQLSNHATMAWAPLLFLFMNKLFERPRARVFFGCSLLVGLMATAGDMEGFTYGFFFIFLFIIFHAGLGLRRRFFSRVLVPAAAVAAGLAMSAGMLFCLVELWGSSVRSGSCGLELEFMGLLRGLSRYLPDLLFPWKLYSERHPSAAYNHGLTPFYFGFLPLVAAGGSLFLLRKDRSIRALWSAGLAVLFLVILKKTPVVKDWFSMVPLLGKLGTPERAIELVQLAAVLSAGLCFDRFRSRPRKKTVLVVSSLMLGWGGLTLLLSPWLTGGVSRIIAGGVAVLAGGALFSKALLWRGGDFRKLIPAAVSAAVAADVYLLALFSVPRTEKSRFRLEPRLERFLKKQAPGSRFISFQKLGPDAAAPDLPGLITAASRLDSPFGFMRLPLCDYFRFLALLDPQIIKDWDQIFYRARSEKKVFFAADLYNPEFLSNRSLHLLNLLGVRYVFSRGLSFRFSSPYSLLNENALVKGDWLAYPHEHGSYAEFFRARGRKAIRVSLPYLMEFESFIHPGTILALELRIESSGEDNLFFSVEAEARERGKENRKSKLLFHEVYRGSGSGVAKEHEVRVSLAEIEGEKASLRLKLESREPGARAALIDVRFVKKDAVFKRLAPGPIDIYLNGNALPREFIAHHALSLPEDEVQELMQAPARWDPGRTVLFREGDASPKLISLTSRAGERPLPPEPVEVLARSPQSLILKARAFAAGWLFVSDTYFPGWRVWVDGREQRIHRADLVFRAVFLPEGEHQVEFRYQPAGFRVGLWTGLIFLAGGILLFVGKGMGRKTA